MLCGALRTRPVRSVSSCFTYPHRMFSCTEAQGEGVLKVVRPHLLYLVGSEVSGEAGSRVWPNSPPRLHEPSRVHEPTHSWFESSSVSFFLENLEVSTVASSPQGNRGKGSHLTQQLRFLPCPSPLSPPSPGSLNKRMGLQRTQHVRKARAIWGRCHGLTLFDDNQFLI